LDGLSVFRPHSAEGLHHGYVRFSINFFEDFVVQFAKHFVVFCSSLSQTSRIFDLPGIGGFLSPKGNIFQQALKYWIEFWFEIDPYFYSSV